MSATVLSIIAKVYPSAFVVNLAAGLVVALLIALTVTSAERYLDGPFLHRIDVPLD